MAARTIAAGALAGALAFTLAAPKASAITVARVTRHGYIMIDDDMGPMTYEGRVPVANTQATLNFVADVTQTLDRDRPDDPRGQYVAVMQTNFENAALAFYIGMINNTLGIGIRSPIDRTRETFDLNPLFGTSFPVTGFIFLNAIGLYQDGPRGDFGRYLICTQEFGHRYGAVLRIPVRPANSLPASDGGVPDDAASVPDDAAADAGPPYTGPDLAEDDLLGRQRAHWSYFVNTGGSPMEGNNWAEITPGVFRTGRPTFRFSPLDMYSMGLIAASDVPPFWLITQPDVMNQRDQNGHVIFRESPTEYSGRTITIHGERVTYTIDDIVRKNGPRVPAYRPTDPDAGVGGDGGLPGVRPGDMPVTWVLLTTSDQNLDALATQFDDAIESCTLGYNGATGDRSHLVAEVGVVPPDAAMPDAASDASASDANGDANGDASEAGDAGDAGGDGSRTGMHATGGCGACATSPAGGGKGAAGVLGLAVAIAAAAGGARRRRRVG